jgi:hypothetical protein
LDNKRNYGIYLKNTDRGSDIARQDEGQTFRNTPVFLETAKNKDLAESQQQKPVIWVTMRHGAPRGMAEQTKK